MTGMEIFGVAVVPLIIGIVQVLKKVGLSARYAGLISWIIGVVVGLSYGLTEGGWTILKSVVIGSAFGLSAVGAYSTKKSITQKKYKLLNH